MTRAATLAVTALALVPGAALAADLKVATTDARDVTSTTATLNADVEHATSGGDVAWQYGRTTSYGATTLAVTVPAKDAKQQASLPLTCLTPSASYHVRAVVTSGLTVAYGADKTFKTKAGTADAGCQTTGNGDSGAPESGTAPTTIPATTPATPTSTAPAGTDGATGGTGAGGTTAGDGSAATTAPGIATKDVTPVLGRTLAAAAIAGKVTATAPSGAAVDLSDARAIPTGTVVDTRVGAVELKTALDGDGHTQTGRFWGGKFEVRQDRRHRGLTQIVLRGGRFASCAAAGARAHTAATSKKKPPRALWGSDRHGRFQTRGRGSVATVRGTRWLTEDRCDGTRTTVAAGAVAVRDLARGKTVVVTKGHTYLARLAP